MTRQQRTAMLMAKSMTTILPPRSNKKEQKQKTKRQMDATSQIVKLEDTRIAVPSRTQNINNFVFMRSAGVI